MPKIKEQPQAPSYKNFYDLSKPEDKASVLELEKELESFYSPWAWELYCEKMGYMKKLTKSVVRITQDGPWYGKEVIKVEAFPPAEIVSSTFFLEDQARYKALRVLRFQRENAL